MEIGRKFAWFGKMAEKVAIEKLGDHNWPLWKFKINLILGEKGLSDVVKSGRPAQPTNDWISKDGIAQSVIGLALEDTQLCHVIGKATAKEMWDALQSHHERKSMCGKVFLMRKLISLRMPERGSMAEHLSEITLLHNRLAGIGETMTDHWLVSIILSSLPESYNALIMSLESRPEDELSLDFVRGRLLDEWRRRCGGDSRGGGGAEQPQRALQTGTKSKQKCHYCGKEGHFKRDCRKWMQDQQRKGDGREDAGRNFGRSKPKANIAKEESEVCFSVRPMKADERWYLDSGCTSHMTGDVSKLVSVNESRKQTICLADGNKVLSEGFGDCRVNTCDGSGDPVNLKLKNVLLVPDLKNNLLSVSKIADEGYDVTFSESECLIKKNESVIVAGIREGNLYRLKSEKEQSLLVDANHRDGCQHIWHRRLGHRHPEDIAKIVRDGLGTGLNLTDCGIRSVCGTCCEGKLSRLPFPKSESKSKAVLDLIHSDLCGQMEVVTPSGNRYILTLIDDFSRFCVIYLLERKSQADEKIREFVQLARTQFGKTPRVLRTDGGGEYSSESFKSFLRNEGILLQQTAPYSPQQNGKAERMNRSLIEMTRCLLRDADMDKRYWGEAVHTANYLLNRLPCSATGKTPYELWYGERPDYKHLRIFGSTAYVHVPKEKRKKLDQKSHRMIFVGYADGRKAYRFLDPETDAVTISRDAKFVEDFSKAETIREVIPAIASPEGRKAVPEGNSVEFDVDRVPVVEAEEEATDDELDRENGDDADFSEFDTADESDFHGFPEEEYLRRSQRTTRGKAPARLIEEVNSVRIQEESEPKTFREAMSCSKKDQWKIAMEEELASHRDLKTWELVDPPQGKKVLGSRWVFKIKRNASGEPVKYKARLVAQGCGQRSGVDFEEVYAPVATQATFRTLLAVASYKKMVLKHIDIKTAYLNGSLTEEVYMRQPPGFSKPDSEGKVCRLLKSVYGLRQSARCWNMRMNEVLKEMGFTPSSADPCLYVRDVDGKQVYIVVYVDDVVIGSDDEEEVDRVHDEIGKHFETTGLGELKYFLGLEVDRCGGNYSVCLSGYIQRVAEQFGLGDCKSSRTPMDEAYARGDLHGQLLPDNADYRSLVGALLYISVHARPDIAVATAILARKVSQPTDADWTAAKRVVRYLRGSADWKLRFSGSAPELLGYCDADWSGDHRTRKSTSGFVFTVGGTAVAWRSKQQNLVALSSMESEYIALCEATQEVLWLRRLLADLGFKPTGPTVLHEDNQSCIAFVRSERVGKRSKHIETKEMFVRSLCEKGDIKLQYLCSEEMIADALTKPLGTVRNLKLSRQMGLSNDVIGGTSGKD